MKLFNITSAPLTECQIAAAKEQFGVTEIVNMPDELQSSWASLLLRDKYGICRAIQNNPKAGKDFVKQLSLWLFETSKGKDECIVLINEHRQDALILSIMQNIVNLPRKWKKYGFMTVVFALCEFRTPGFVYNGVVQDKERTMLHSKFHVFSK